MATIVVFGGTGYTGGNIAREAASRGHHVISVSRSKPAEPIEGVTYVTGTVEDVASRSIPGADAVVATLSPRGETAAASPSPSPSVSPSSSSPARSRTCWG